MLDRVRANTPRGETASAGVARWDGEEPSELLVVRCEDARMMWQSISGLDRRPMAAGLPRS